MRCTALHALIGAFEYRLKSSTVFVEKDQLSGGYFSEDKFILVEVTLIRFVLKLEEDPGRSRLIDRDTKKVLTGKRLRTRQIFHAASDFGASLDTGPSGYGQSLGRPAKVGKLNFALGLYSWVMGGVSPSSLHG